MAEKQIASESAKLEKYTAPEMERHEPVKLVQEFRNFDFISPWEGMNRELPGDEKAGRPAAESGPGGEETA